MPEQQSRTAPSASTAPRCYLEALPGTLKSGGGLFRVLPDEVFYLFYDLVDGVARDAADLDSGGLVGGEDYSRGYCCCYQHQGHGRQDEAGETGEGAAAAWCGG